jgi:RimJ/RimL family protein N-acetyltransferase
MFIGEKVQLRPLERDDLPRFVRWFADAEVRRHLSIYLPFSLAQEERWFDSLLDRLKSEQTVLMAIETIDGVLIGNVGLDAINWKDRNAELGIVIGEKEYWNQGYGTDAIRTILQVAFDQMNLHRVFLRVDADNPRGIRCYEKVGFRLEGTYREAVYRGGAYRDQHVMGILEPEFGSE